MVKPVDELFEDLSCVLVLLRASISDSRGLYALHIQDRGTIHVIIVNPFSSREVNTSLLERHFYAQMKGVKSNCRRNVMKFRVLGSSSIAGFAGELLLCVAL